MNELTLLEKITTEESLVQAMTTVSTIVGTKVTAIKTDEQEVQYSEMLIQAKGILDATEAKRKTFVDPYNRLVKNINSWFKTSFSDPITTKRNEITNAIRIYRVKKAEDARKSEEKAEKIRQQMQAKADKAGLNIQIPTIITPPAERITRTDIGQVQERKQWVAEVTNKMDIIKAVASGSIPDSVLDVNMGAIRGLTKSGLVIPGIKAGYELGISTRKA